MRSSSTPRWLWQLDAGHRLLITLGAAIVVILLSHSLSPSIRILLTWDVSVACFLALTWSIILTAHPRQIQSRARTDDTNRVIISIVTLSAASFSLLAVILLLSTSKNLPRSQEGTHIALSILAVAGSWLVVHTIFCFRYAHHYYSPLIDSSQEHEEASKGLDFPNDTTPDYIDFAYFAYVIGMTAQVSDVQVTTRAMRRVVLIHSIFSCAFNTVVVALSINIVSQML